MIKFIIELDEEYINERAKELNIDDDTKGSDVIKALASHVAFKRLKEKVDNGESEFLINKDNIRSIGLRMFDKTLLDVAITVVEPED